MERKGRWWAKVSHEFRSEACRLVEEGHAADDLARTLGMPKYCLKSWLTQREDGVYEHLEGPVDPSNEQLEIRRLRGVLARTEAERDLLKALVNAPSKLVSVLVDRRSLERQSIKVAR